MLENRGKVQQQFRMIEGDETALLKLLCLKVIRQADRQINYRSE